MKFRGFRIYPFRKLRYQHILTAGLLCFTSFTMYVSYTWFRPSLKFIVTRTSFSMDRKHDINTNIKYDINTNTKRLINTDTNNTITPPPPTRQVCIHPHMDLHNAEIMAALGTDVDVVCSTEKNWVYVDNGTFIISKTAIKTHGDIKCSYTPIIRENDFNIRNGKVVKTMISGMKITSDFFSVDCIAKDGSRYVNIHEEIMYAPELHGDGSHSEKTLLPDSMGVNVLIIAVDSMSRLQWERKLPLVHKFLTEELNAFVFEGYNILGDGTPQATFPLLTGKTEIELPEARRSIPGAVSMDDFPFIWKDFKKLGYVTQMGEDEPYIGMFTYRLTGFNKQPTDHYSRTYYKAVGDSGHNHNLHCRGSEPNIQLALNWINDTYRMYPNRLKFMFHFLTEFSHGKVHLNHVDVRLRDFLRKFKADGHMENTILAVMSDHGARYSKIRNTTQGKLEERLPYVSLSVPPWFQHKYPESYRNLQTNKKRLTTPFDLHEMLRDVISSNRDVPAVNNRGEIPAVNTRGISVFRVIPADRRCLDAGIAEHWCTCLDWHSVSIDDPIVTAITNDAVNHFNNMLQPAVKYCETLSLLSIISAQSYQPNTKLLTYSHSRDSDGRMPVFQKSHDVQITTYQIVLKTAPNDGLYEISLNYDSNDKKIQFDPKQLSRTNTYGDAPECIYDLFPHLRQFCLCKQTQ